MKVITRPAALAALTASWKRRGQHVGFVPTMGALHDGHASLIKRAKKENKRVVVSIFVNPKQFGPKEDFSRYPRPFSADRRLCERLGADALYHPSAADIYPDGSSTTVTVPGLSARLCGRMRPGHFEGVTTVVAQLLSTVGADRAYFGEKDFQQLVIIRKMAHDLRFPVKIIGCATVRETDGLALSSRNRYLSPRNRGDARLFPEALRWGARCGITRPARLLAGVRARLRSIPGAVIEYVELVDPVSLEPARRPRKGVRLIAAIRLGRTRLIDNLPLS